MRSLLPFRGISQQCNASGQKKIMKILLDPCEKFTNMQVTETEMNADSMLKSTKEEINGVA